MFQGHANTAIDEKGRLIVPAKFRRHILPEASGILNVTLGRDKCIWLFPSYEWTKVLKTVQTTNPYTTDEVSMRRQMLYYADELTIDSQHRVLMPQELLKLVGIKKEIMLLGQIERIELWDPSEYERYLKSSSESYEGVMQKVMTKLYSDTAAK